MAAESTQPVAKRDRGPLSRTKAATRSRLIEAAVGLAGRHGYDAVTMRDVATEAGVSAATAYEYYRSKDHLLADALIDLSARSAGAASRRRGTGTPADQLRVRFRAIIRAAEANPQLYRALFRAYVAVGSPERAGSFDAPGQRAGDPSGPTGWPSPSWIEMVLRTDGTGARAHTGHPGQPSRASSLDGSAGSELAGILSFALLGAMVFVASGGSPRQAARVLEATTRELLPDPSSP